MSRAVSGRHKSLLKVSAFFLFVSFFRSRVEKGKIRFNFMRVSVLEEALHAVVRYSRVSIGHTTAGAPGS